MNAPGIHAESIGSGPDVLLLHGLFGMGGNLGALARSLADAYRVHSLDLPDHGRSAWTPGADLPALAAAVGAWMDEAGVSRAHLCGHSLGGKVAMQLALAAPGRVSSLLVVDIAPVAYAASHESVFAALAAVEAAAVTSRREAAAVLRQYLEEEGVVQFLLLSFARDGEGAWRWRFNRAGLEDSYPAYLAAPKGSEPYGGPALFIRGELSPYVTAAEEPAIYRLFPAARLATLAGTGHWLHAEKPDQFQSLVSDFLAGSAGTAR